MTNDITTTAAQAHVKGFVTSYAKCWEHYQGYMQDPSKTIEGFRQECQEEADEQGVDIKLPAIRTFENRTAKLKQAGVIPARLKSDKAEAVKSRKRREKGSNPQIGEMTPTDDSQSSTTHLSPGKSDESPFIECNSYSNDTILDVTPLQQRSGPVPFSKEVCSTQPEMDTDCPQQDAELVSMDTEAIRQRDADFAELERLVERSHDIIKRHFSIRTDEASKFTEWQWRDLSQQYGAVVYAIDIRWERLKSELAEDRADFKRRVDQCFGKAGDTSDSTVPQLD